ncbi:hypothetical protein E2C01_026974 [Portunus trituberculatus]|uniref:Uncharacterized protein n=1 Tax=Portunus trituberculatus TaxID=210409 RepID=A0A5B7EKF6_PORTR|nr:hypothetical protein [Portunus trituberculatus]
MRRVKTLSGSGRYREPLRVQYHSLQTATFSNLYRVSPSDLFGLSREGQPAALPPPCPPLQHIPTLRPDAPPPRRPAVVFYPCCIEAPYARRGVL